MSTANPEPYDERIRLAEIIADARELLGAPVISYPGRIGRLEAMLKMLADSAAEALRLNEPAPRTYWHEHHDCGRENCAWPDANGVWPCGWSFEKQRQEDQARA